MQEAIFAEPRLARIYDLWEGERIDLPHYLAIAAELGARSVLDIGCGTGNWVCMLAERGFQVVGLDAAAASLDVARAEPGAQRVRWIHGDVTSLPALAVDLATMTGNVSNVFLTPQEWLATVAGIYAALRPGGYLVFESVDPAGQPWLGWNRQTTYGAGSISAFAAFHVNRASWHKAILEAGARAPASITALSCTSPRNCLAGGYFTDRAGRREAFTVSERNGIWRAPAELRGIVAVAAPNGSSSITAAACGSAGNCVVGGTYPNRFGYDAPFAAREVAGKWRGHLGRVRLSRQLCCRR